jgi:uncharacterized phage protein (TIGR01671 family)
MREIKFRAWDKGRMYEDVMVGHGNSVLSVGVQGMEHRIGNTKVDAIMQYTGLKDKNDKEIYEKDIIEFMWAGIKRREVVEWCQSECAFLFARKNPLDNEVIGNIYSNPELIALN